MTLVEHIYELRRRLAIALLAVAIGTALGFFWYTTYPFGLPSLGQILTEPYCALPPENRVQLGGGQECRLVAFGVFEQFTLRLKVAATAGVLMSSPIWFAQLWGFITPGLYAKEKRFAYTFVSLAVVLFSAGAVLAYYVVTQALQFLFTVGGDIQTTVLRGSDYFSLLIALLIIFGVSFELPLLVVMLNRVGIVSYAQLSAGGEGWSSGCSCSRRSRRRVRTRSRCSPWASRSSCCSSSPSRSPGCTTSGRPAGVWSRAGTGLDPDQPSPLDDRLGSSTPAPAPAPRIEPLPPASPAPDRGSDGSTDRWDAT